MRKRLTITLDGQVCAGLHRVIERRNIESLAWPHVVNADIKEGYRRMSGNGAHETEAPERAEPTIGEVYDHETAR